MKQQESNTVPAISITDLRKTYDKTDALKGISFDINEGDFFGFLGPNGAGKTTTINLITGLANLTSGSISVFGKDVVKEYRETRRMIGLAAQEPNFDPFFPLGTVLAFQAGYHGIPRNEAKERADRLLKRFGLWEDREKTTRQISGGMKRRLLIAKALVNDPKILILDEPTAGVDVELRRDMWKMLRELNDEGKTILLTTHYIEEAEELCNRIGIIHQGEMKALEDKSALMEQLGEKRMKIITKELSGTAEQDIRALDGVTIQDNAVLFDTDKATTLLPEVSRLLEHHKVTIVDMDIESFDLEDIFLQLTDMK